MAVFLAIVDRNSGFWSTVWRPWPVKKKKKKKKEKEKMRKRRQIDRSFSHQF